MLRSLHVVLLVVAYGAAAIRGVVQMSGGYDFGWYHLPAALRLLGFDNYTPEPWVQAWLAGLPPLPQLAQAALIGLTGRPSASASANLAALAVATAGVAHLFRGRVAWRWLLTAFLAVPSLNLQLGRGYVDLFTAAWVFLSFGALLALQTGPTPPASRTHAHLLVCAGFAGASLSKATAWPLLAPLGVCYAYELWREWRAGSLRAAPAVLWCALAAALASSWPVRNAVVFGNPTHPILTPLTVLVPEALAKPVPYDLLSKPARVAPQLARIPVPLQFWYSALELHRWETDEPFKWSMEGAARGGPKSPHYRLGGFFYLTFLTLLAAAVAAAAKNAVPRRALAALGGMVLVVMPLANGYELRYWLAVPMAMALVTALAWSAWTPRMRGVFGFLLLFAMIFVCDRVKTLRGIEATGVADVAPVAARAFWAAHPPFTGEAHVIEGQHPATIYFTGPTLREYRIVEADQKPFEVWGR